MQVRYLTDGATRYVDATAITDWTTVSSVRVTLTFRLRGQGDHRYHRRTAPQAPPPPTPSPCATRYHDPALTRQRGIALIASMLILIIITCWAVVDAQVPGCRNA